MPARTYLLALLLGCTGATDGPTDTTDTTDDSPTTADTGPSTTGDTATFDPCATMTLEVGNAEKAHTPAESLDPVILVHGAQGGWHIDVSGLVTGTDALVGIDPLLTVVSSGTQLAGDQPSTFLMLDEVETCVGQFAGVRAYVDDAEVPKGIDDYQAFICTLEDEELDLSVVVTDVATKTSTEQSLRLVAKLDVLDATYNCP
ncbi:MAG: hypothetical protein KTR31_40825 [Myxococcales bacterium]|nr:hypothetical protein [Myxococcales bacterium]